MLKLIDLLTGTKDNVPFTVTTDEGYNYKGTASQIFSQVISSGNKGILEELVILAGVNKNDLSINLIQTTTTLLTPTNKDTLMQFYKTAFETLCSERQKDLIPILLELTDAIRYTFSMIDTHLILKAMTYCVSNAPNNMKLDDDMLLQISYDPVFKATETAVYRYHNLDYITGEPMLLHKHLFMLYMLKREEVYTNPYVLKLDDRNNPIEMNRHKHGKFARIDLSEALKDSNIENVTERIIEILDSIIISYDDNKFINICQIFDDCMVGDSQKMASIDLELSNSDIKWRFVHCKLQADVVKEVHNLSEFETLINMISNAAYTESKMHDYCKDTENSAFNMSETFKLIDDDTNRKITVYHLGKIIEENGALFGTDTVIYAVISADGYACTIYKDRMN